MRIGGLGVPELILVLAIVVLLFGVGRISKVMGELGKGLRAFREGLEGDRSATAAQEQEATTSEADDTNPPA